MDEENVVRQALATIRRVGNEQAAGYLRNLLKVPELNTPTLNADTALLIGEIEAFLHSLK